MITNKLLKVLVAIAFVAMIVVNALANILPINGIDTGAVSNAYPNLFAPIGLTFAVWGLIYLLLAGYTVYQFKTGWSAGREQLLAKINRYFLASSVLNFVWIFSWHYQVIWLSLLLIVSILICLIKIADILRGQKLQGLEKVLIGWPFSIYFGWITVATIANATVWLVSWHWNGFGLSDVWWTVTVLLVGALIGAWRLVKDQQLAYGLVIMWAYFGILLKHLSPLYFAGRYPAIVATVIFCLAIIGLTELFLLYRTKTIK
jgi:hypothetical protein